MKGIKELLGDMPKTEPMSEYEVLKKESDVYNNTVGELDEFDCPLCKNKGYIHDVVFNESYNQYIKVMRKCSCMAKRENIRKIKRSGLGEYVTKRFDDFVVKEDWQKTIKEKAIKFCKDESNAWFVAIGQSGAGKTLISSIVANYMMVVKDKNVKYVTWTDFISKLKRDMMADNTKAVSEYLDQIKNVDILFIDELLKKYNETDLKYIIEIINYRYTNDLKTIITSEKSLQELIAIDEATFSRVVEKSNGYLVTIAKDMTKNQRLKGVLNV